MKCVVLALVLHLCLAAGDDVDASQEIPLLSGESLVDYLRKNQDLFEVKSDRTPGLEFQIMNEKFINQGINPVVKDDFNDTGDDIPESYDPRTIWTNCSSLFYIPDQANCASCWAVSTAAAISDRICIATKAEKQVQISAADIISCCSNCGYGCGGGYPLEAWQFFMNEGVVSGGDYHSKDCCRPYPIHPCGHHENQTYYGECHEFNIPAPPCRRICQAGFRKQYRLDKRYGKTAYRLPQSVTAIQRDILRHGPVVATYALYADFDYYKSGIYKYTAGNLLGYHAVKMIGWGNENGTDYWLIANSLNTDWGEKGFFRIIRGINDCGIEEGVYAGLVDVDSL
ncbi:hypothetical protein V3C99_004697 [Haemonchus contortus]